MPHRSKIPSALNATPVVGMCVTFLLNVLVGILLLSLTGVAHATILTFNNLGLSASGNIPGEYGDNVSAQCDAVGCYEMGNGFTPNIVVQYRTLTPGPGGGVTHFSHLDFWPDRYGDLVNIAYPVNPTSTGEISLTPQAGWAVRLNSFDLGGWSRADRRDQPVRIVDESYNTLVDFSPLLVKGSGPSHSTIAPNLTHNGIIRIQFGDTWNAGIDNIDFDQVTATSGRSLKLVYAGKLRDGSGRGDCVPPDGELDDTFLLTLEGSGGTLAELRLDASTGGIWNTVCGDGFWDLAVAQSATGPLLPLPFIIGAGEPVAVIAADVAPPFYLAPGTAVTLSAHFADGTTATATATVPSGVEPPSLTLSYENKLDDRVGQGNNQRDPDGQLDGTFKVVLSPESGGRTLTSLLFQRTGGGVWDTTGASGFWTLGIAPGLASPLINGPDDGINLALAPGGSVYLFAADLPPLDLFSVGSTFTLSAQFADRTTATATVIIMPPPSGSSIVSVQDGDLIVRRRKPDGSLAPPISYVIRGVNWSPASKNTNTSTGDPNNAVTRRREFGNWYLVDIPLMKAMNVNTVRVYLDLGLPGDQDLVVSGLTILDEFYKNDIMVIMTVDDASNNRDRLEEVVPFYRDHPAVLMWMVGSEWNINCYFKVPQQECFGAELRTAVTATEDAAARIKSLDSHHPVATSYGDIDIDAAGKRLADTARYVDEISSVDIWSLNVFRSSGFGTLFDQWASITTKPMFLGEFGTDAVRLSCSSPRVDETMQANWNLYLWEDILRHRDVALGGLVFEWNDEWWKVRPPNSQERGGFSLPGGHPDDFANEEYFGIVDIERVPREVYHALADAFDPLYVPRPPAVTFRAVSAGASVPSLNPFEFGFVHFAEDERLFHCATGGSGGGRGFTVAVITSGGEHVEQFDTWRTRATCTEMNRMIAFLKSLPDGVLVFAAVGDEAGLNRDNSCDKLSSACVEDGLRALEMLGSTQIRNYCFRDSWAMAAVTGAGRAIQEQLGKRVPASVEAMASE